MNVWWWGVVGGIASLVADAYPAMSKDEPPSGKYRRISFWAARLLIAGFGGVLAYIWAAKEPLTAFLLGFAALEILQVLRRKGSLNGTRAGRKLRDFLTRVRSAVQVPPSSEDHPEGREN